MEKTNIHPDLEENKNKSFRKNISLIVLGALAAVSLLTVALVGKQQDIRQRAQLATTTFLETFDGQPTSPLIYTNPRWEIVHQASWSSTYEGTEYANDEAQHGPGCESPGVDGSVTHHVSNFAEMIFNCRDHIMTQSPGLTYLTPNHMVDFSAGPATIRFDVSTLSLSSRDWIGVWIQDWDTQEQSVRDEDLPTTQGKPRNAVHIEQGASGPAFESATGAMHIETYDSNRNLATLINPSYGVNWRAVLTPSAVTRTTVEIQISRTHIKVWLPQFNYTLVEGDVQDLGFSRGVVSFAHFSYSPSKGQNPLTGNPVGTQNTHHWDNVTINPAVPFSIIKSDKRATNGQPASSTFNFDAPAPANSYLRFTAFGKEVKVSLNGGAYQTATRTGPYRAEEAPTSYFMPIPQGTTRATFDVVGGYGFVSQVENVNIFSLTSSGTTPAPTSSITNTPTPLPTSGISPTATPTRIPTPTPTKTATPTTPVTITPTGTACSKTGDLNCDNQVGILDLSILLSSWNTTNAVADINNDGNITILDLSILLSNWGL